MGKLVEGLWDCNYCGTKGNRGSIRDCPNCGRPRDENTKFYMSGTVTYVSEEEAETINRNPDWVCPYCDSLNSDLLNICVSCGSARTSENLDYFSIKEKQSRFKDSSDTTSQTFIEDSVREKKQITGNSIMEKLKSNSGFVRNYWKAIISVPLILGLIVGIVYLFIPKNEEITIEQFKWTRSIEVERFQTIDESGWALPSGARLQYTQTEISHYQSVLDHYETRTRQVAKQRICGYEEYVTGYRDLGNGYFEEIISQRPIYETYYETETYQEPIYKNEPVYATKYYYEIDKWLHERSVSTNGLDKEPYWGEVELHDDERISGEFETYYIIGINSKGKKRTIYLDYNDWIKLNVNQTVKVKFSILGEGKLIE